MSAHDRPGTDGHATPDKTKQVTNGDLFGPGGAGNTGNHGDTSMNGSGNRLRVRIAIIAVVNVSSVLCSTALMGAEKTP